MAIPEKAINILLESKRHFFVADGGNENPTMAFGATGEMSELIFLLLRAAQDNIAVREIIIGAAKCLTDSTAAHLRAGVRDINAKGEIQDL